MPRRGTKTPAKITAQYARNTVATIHRAGGPNHAAARLKPSPPSEHAHKSSRPRVIVAARKSLQLVARAALLHALARRLECVCFVAGRAVAVHPQTLRLLVISLR